MAFAKQMTDEVVAEREVVADFELPSVAREDGAPTAESTLQRMLIFSASGGKYGESRASIHQKEKTAQGRLLFGET